MKNLSFLFIFFFIIGCSSNKAVYWCGDHPCKNKKEKKAYFEETMIVEIKRSKNKNFKDSSEIEKIINKTQSKEKKIINTQSDLKKQAKLEKKRQIKEEKNLAKQIKLEEKRRIKEEKDLAKQIKLEEKRRIKERKKLSKRKIVVDQKKLLKKSIVLDAGSENIKIESSEFSELIKKITKKNALRPFPNINDIPN